MINLVILESDVDLITFSSIEDVYMGFSGNKSDICTIIQYLSEYVDDKFYFIGISKSQNIDFSIYNFICINHAIDTALLIALMDKARYENSFLIYCGENFRRKG